MILKVKRGGAICGPDRKIYAGGQVIPGGLLSDKQVEEHVKSGYLQVIRRGGEIELGADLPPGVSSPAGMSDEGKPVRLTSKWSLDPDGLRGLDVDQLNVMVLERDASIDPFESAEEAAAWLSQDYEAPKKA